MPSNRKKARRALRDFIQRTAGELPHAAREDQYVRTPAGRLFLQDIRTVLHSEREARRTARRVISEKLELQRTATKLAGKNAVYVQRLKEWDAQSPATLSTWKTLQAELARVREENTTLRNTVSELSRKIQDPPGSHERWQALRAGNASLAAQRDSLQTSLAQAETQIRTQAGTIEKLNAAKLAAEKQNRILQSSYDHAAAAHKKAEAALAAVPALRKLSEDWDRDLRALTAERDRERENATRLAKKLDAAQPRTYADILREPDLRKFAEFLETFLKGGEK